MGVRSKAGQTMPQDEPRPCTDCKIGYHAPFDRFERVAVDPHGPTFLNRCKLCGTLWHETLRFAKRVSESEALALYPDAQV
jgi:hypothetical protein